MTLGLYDNFPAGIHGTQRFTTTVPSRQLQEKLIQALYKVNRQEFSFEEVSNPTFPEGKVIFEFGLAEAESFNFIDEEELHKAQSFLTKERLHTMDFFCSVRYYRGRGAKKTALKFDYYMLRTIFSKDTLEVQVFHERGPRYVSPQDLTMFLFNRVNEAANRKVLKQANV